MSDYIYRESRFVKVYTLLELIFHSAVRSVRKSHGHALIGLIINVLQTVLIVAVFYGFMLFMGADHSEIRGDFMLYIMTGVFLYMCHVKTVGAVSGAEGPTSAMMKHAPMNTIVSIGAAALGELYIQILSMIVVLFFYHAIWQPISIYDPLGALLMFLLTWFSGVALGTIFLAIRPWAPGVAAILTQTYSRLNMFGSGKMFVANGLPGFLLPLFTWNPLFHIIDQARGFTFLNYRPYYTDPWYPLYITCGIMLVGLMGEFYTRRQASISWDAKN